MLNRELLQFTRNSGRISIRFLKEDPVVLAYIENLLALYRDACRNNFTESQLEDMLEPFAKTCGSSKVFAGLNKVLQDHCSFTSQYDQIDMIQRRKEIFSTAASVFSCLPQTVGEYRMMVREKLSDPNVINTDIYGDLPEFDRLTAVPDWSVEKLCNIYNINLVQGLLLYAVSIDLVLTDPKPMLLRKFMRRLKFYRLLADVDKVSPSEIKLTISGPAAIFKESKKYGLQLAGFFQAVLLLKKWKMRAILKLDAKRSDEILTLNSDRCKLKSSLLHWSSCVPEEVALFIKAFRKEATEWREAAEADFPRIAGNGAFFPDFSFTRADDQSCVIHVELFHRCHAAALTERLKFLAENPQFPLIIGIDRSLSEKSEKDFVNQYGNIADKIFFFSNYPGVDRVRKMLNRFCKA